MVYLDKKLNSGYVCRLQSLGAFNQLERYGFTFRKGFETIAVNCGKMNKNIFSIFLLKKTKPLAVIEPFYRSIYHVLHLLILLV